MAPLRWLLIFFRVRSAVRPPGHARLPGWQVGAAHRSAAMAGVARPVPFRTRKLRPLAPMVLRVEPVGEQGAADRWTAPAWSRRAPERGPFWYLSEVIDRCEPCLPYSSLETSHLVNHVLRDISNSVADIALI